jgi:hypothetical protein
MRIRYIYFFTPITVFDPPSLHHSPAVAAGPPLEQRGKGMGLHGRDREVVSI